MSIELEVSQLLRGVGLNLRDDVLATAVRRYAAKHAHTIGAVAASAAAQYILNHVLVTDLRDVSSGGLPATMTQGVLAGPMLLQVDEGVDVGPRAGAPRDESDETDACVCFAGHAVGAPKRVLKLCATDGVAPCVCVEAGAWQRLTCALSLPGAKMIVRDAPMRRGVLLLTDANVHWLGGFVPALVSLTGHVRGVHTHAHTHVHGSAAQDAGRDPAWMLPLDAQVQPSSPPLLPLAPPASLQPAACPWAALPCDSTCTLTRTHVHVMAAVSEVAAAAGQVTAQLVDARLSAPVRVASVVVGEATRDEIGMPVDVAVARYLSCPSAILALEPVPDASRDAAFSWEIVRRTVAGARVVYAALRRLRAKGTSG